MVDTGGKRTFALTGLGFVVAKTSLLGRVTPNFGLCVSDLSGIRLRKEKKNPFLKKTQFRETIIFMFQKYAKGKQVW